MFSPRSDRKGNLHRLVQKKRMKKKAAVLPLRNKDVTKIKNTSARAIVDKKGKVAKTNHCKHKRSTTLSQSPQKSDSPKRKKKKCGMVRLPLTMKSPSGPSTSRGVPSAVDHDSRRIHLLSESSSSGEEYAVRTPVAPKISSDALRRRVKRDFEEKRSKAKAPKSCNNAKKKLYY